MSSTQVPDLRVELIAGRLTLSEHFLVLLDIHLEVTLHNELKIQCNKSVANIFDFKVGFLLATPPS